MKDYLYHLNATLYSKFGISLPIPLRNHFYKGKSLSFKYHWLCKDCSTIFNLTPYNKYKGIFLSDLCCPTCASKNVYHGHSLAKAIIDGKPTEELYRVIELIKPKH